MNASFPSVRHDTAGQTFELITDGYLAHADYFIEGERIAFTHTFVPPELRGRGLAGQPVRSALAHARTHHLKVVPACYYVAAFMKLHSEFADLLA